MRRNQINAALFEPLAKLIGVIATVGYDALRLLAWAASRPGDADFRDCGFRKLNFTRRGTFETNYHRKSFTID